MLLIAGVFSAVFSGYSMAIYLSQAASGFIKPQFVIQLVLTKTLIATEIILPISVYVAVLLAVEQLKRGHETTAMQALGFGPRQAAKALAGLLFAFALLVALLSMWLRPLAYRQVYLTNARAEAAFDLLALEPNRFYVGHEGQRVVMVDGKSEDGELRRVFIWSKNDREELVLRADRLRPKGIEDSQGRDIVESKNLRIWRIAEQGCEIIADSGELTASVDFSGITPLGYKRKAASTLRLARSDDADDIAEFQWRVTRPISAFLLGFLALFVAGWARTSQRSTRTIAIGVAVCLAYYLISISARRWVRDEIVDAWPGMWWVDALLALIVIALYTRRGRSPRRSRATTTGGANS